MAGKCPSRDSYATRRHPGETKLCLQDRLMVNRALMRSRTPAFGRAKTLPLLPRRPAALLLSTATAATSHHMLEHSDTALGSRELYTISWRRNRAHQGKAGSCPKEKADGSNAFLLCSPLSELIYVT